MCLRAPARCRHLVLRSCVETWFHHSSIPCDRHASCVWCLGALLLGRALCVLCVSSLLLCGLLFSVTLVGCAVIRGIGNLKSVRSGGQGERSGALQLRYNATLHGTQLCLSFAEAFCESLLSSLVTKKGQNRGAVTIGDGDDLYH